MAKRRGHGEGSIYRRKDGRWAGSVEVPGGKGRRPRKTVYGKTRAEVQRKVDEARRAVEDGRPLPNDRLTVEKYLQWWITDHVPGRVRSRTLMSYEQKIRHINRILGGIRLSRLTATQVESCFNQLLHEEHTPGGVQSIRRVFRAAMKEADKKDLVVKNVVALADGPKVPDREKYPFTIEEVQAIRRQMENDRLMPLFFVGLALGLREGEAFGLRWSDLDLNRGLVHIRQQAQPRRGGGFEFDEPKTQASKATLELTRNQVSILRKQRRVVAKERLIAGSEWEDHDLVFPSARGTPYCASNVRRRFIKICEGAEVRPRRIHDWRVTAGSWLADLNVHPETAKQVLRHSKQSTTMKHYTRTNSERRREAIEALDALFNG
jgi:integrase